MIIVLIDDDLEEIEFMKMALERAYNGSTCVSFNECEDALAELAAALDVPDYIFIDVNMVKMTGEECLVALRQIERLRSMERCLWTQFAHYRAIDAYSCCVHAKCRAQMLKRFQ